MNWKIMNSIFGGQPNNLSYIGYTTCPECDDDCAEMWRDDTTGEHFIRCPYIGCDGWGKLRKVESEEQ